MFQVQCYETGWVFWQSRSFRDGGRRGDGKRIEESGSPSKPSQVHGQGEGTRVRWAARLEADERISRVSLNTRRTSSRLLLASACAWVCRDERAAERLIDYTRARTLTRSQRIPSLSSHSIHPLSLPHLLCLSYVFSAPSFLFFLFWNCLIFFFFYSSVLFYPLWFHVARNLFVLFSSKLYFWKFFIWKKMKYKNNFIWKFIMLLIVIFIHCGIFHKLKKLLISMCQFF